MLGYLDTVNKYAVDLKDISSWPKTLQWYREDTIVYKNCQNIFP